MDGQIGKIKIPDVFILHANQDELPIATHNKVGRLKIPTLFTKDNATPAKKPEILQEIPAQYQEECVMLRGAYTYKKKSLYYDPQYTCPYFVGGKLLVEAALQHKDTAACTHLLATDAFKKYSPQELLCDALRNGYYPICHLLLTTGQADVHCEETTRKTPLYWVLYHGHSMQACDLLGLCNLLRQHGADIHKPFKDGRYIYESLAANLNLHKFYTIFPVLKQLGLSPELQDDQGYTAVHRLTRCKDISITSYMNLVIPWQVYPERKILLTLLLIHKYYKQSQSPFGQVPKDVIVKHIMPYVCPFKCRNIDEAVNQQLALLRKLFTLKTNLQRTPENVYINAAPIIQLNVAHMLAPDKVEQHREIFTKATRELMAALDASLNK